MSNGFTNARHTYYEHSKNNFTADFATFSKVRQMTLESRERKYKARSKTRPKWLKNVSYTGVLITAISAGIGVPVFPILNF